MAKRVDARCIKSARSYSIPEAAALLGCSVGTVRNWVREGLRILDRQRPHLIVGDDLKTFLGERRVKRKSRLGPAELYCLSCKAPRQPLGMMADVVHQSATTSRLVGLCEACGGTCNRMISNRQLAEVARIFDVACKDVPTA